MSPRPRNQVSRWNPRPFLLRRRLQVGRALGLAVILATDTRRAARLVSYPAAFAIWPPLTEVLWQIAQALKKQFARFIDVVIGLNYQASRWPVCALVTRQLSTIALITEHSH